MLSKYLYRKKTVITASCCVNLPTGQSKEVEAIWNSMEKSIEIIMENYRKGSFFPVNSS